MPQTVPNQRLITIHKDPCTKDFLQISNQQWMKVNKELSPYCLQLYLYLASNANNFNFALSPQAAEIDAGIKPTSFRKYLALLEKEGYLVWRGGNYFDFYTSPRGENRRTSFLSPNEFSPRKLSRNEEGISFRENPLSPRELNPSPSNIEIDNIQGLTDIIDNGEKLTPEEGEFQKFIF